MCINTDAKTKICFTLILILAVILRLWKLNILPPSLNWDEISHSYNAYSLLKTGKDQWGISWPIFNFRAYGDYPTTANLYLTVLSVCLFGLNVWSTRLPSALAGIGIVVINYFLGKIVFKDTKKALVLMFLVGTAPWAIFTSRAVFQSTISQFFLLLGITLCLYKSSLGLIPLALSMYAYHSTRIIAPIISLPFLIHYCKLIRKNDIKTTISILAFILLTSLSLINLFTPESTARSKWVSILSPAAINEINYSRQIFNGPPIIAKLLFNKPVYFTKKFFSNYLNFFNPIPLFFQGSKQYQYNINDFGLLFPICLPFFYFGLLKNKNKFLFFWYFVGLLPAALTVGDFPTLRLFTVFPLPLVFTIEALYLIKNKFFPALFLILISLGLITYWQKYEKYSLKFSQSWQYGYKEAILFAKKHYQNYDRIAFTKKYGEPHEFVVFFWPWDPKQYQQDPSKIWDFHSDWYWVGAFDKFSFINDWEIAANTFPSKTLLITSPSNYPPVNAKLLKTIYFLDGSAAFDIVSYDN